MAESTKPVRLSKVAREFNLGMTTVVDFLASKGIEVEAKPNTKLDPETYALVKSNFQGDKETKQKAQRSATGLQERESITLASAKKREAKKEEEEPEIDLSQFRKSEAAPVVKRTQPAPAPEAAPEKEEAPAPAAKEEASPAAEAPNAEAPAEAAAAQDGPKVVGKVDLDALKPKKPAKKAAKREEAKPEVQEAAKPAEAQRAEEAKPEAQEAAQDRRGLRQGLLQGHGGLCRPRDGEERQLPDGQFPQGDPAPLRQDTPSVGRGGARSRELRGRGDGRFQSRRRRLGRGVGGLAGCRGEPPEHARDGYRGGGRRGSSYGLLRSTGFHRDPAYLPGERRLGLRGAPQGAMKSGSGVDSLS